MDGNMPEIYEMASTYKVFVLLHIDPPSGLGVEKREDAPLFSIYSLKMNQKDFVFIFAASKEEAIQFYTKTFHQTPLNCHEYSLDFLLTRGNDVNSFRDIRKEFIRFPAIAGYFKRVR